VEQLGLNLRKSKSFELSSIAEDFFTFNETILAVQTACKYQESF